MQTVINVNFPPETEALYKKIVKSRPVGTAMATHARNLLQKGLDATTFNGRKSK